MIINKIITKIEDLLFNSRKEYHIRMNILYHGKTNSVKAWKREIRKV